MPSVSGIGPGLERHPSAAFVATSPFYFPTGLVGFIQRNLYIAYAFYRQKLVTRLENHTFRQLEVVSKVSLSDRQRRRASDSVQSLDWQN